MKKLYELTVLFLLSSGTAFAQLNDSLIVHYTFNNLGAADQSGNGNDGIEIKTSATTDRFGNANHAFLFDGDSS